LKTSTIGGNVAENAGGMRCYKYGVTGNYVLAREAFLVNGEERKTGSHVLKNVAGYDMKSLLIGSEGTLAVFSKIILRLIPLPPCQRLFRVDFNALREAAEFINQIIKANIGPSVLEFMDRSSLAAVYQYQGLPLDDTINASVLIEIDGNQTDVEERKKRFVQLVKSSGAIDYKVSETETELEELWNTRRNLSPAIAKLKPKKVNEDIVVPVSRIPEAVEFINKLAQEYHLLIPLFGHIGDGNIHTNLMVDPNDPEEMKRVEIVLDKMFRYVISVKGSISGEHGIGITKKAFMKYQFTDAEMELFRNVKKAFDPENLLNPGKIF
jgi:glycolate oxidase subunit GlcD